VQITKIAGLDVRITGGADREGGGEGPVVVLLHGFGAAGDDLVPLWRVLQVPREVRFVFPEAPLAPRELGGGRAWWPIDLAALQAERARGQHRDRSREEPDGLATAREHVIALLDAVEERFKVRGDQIVLDNRFFDARIEGTGISDTSRAAVADEIETDIVEIFLQAGFI
jgi:phospholipase/carboxylesterase